MRFNSKWLIIFLFCIPSVSTTGQHAIAFQHLTKKNGLSQSSVFAIAQDSLGFMWFGTRNGLNKFDGYQFKIYQKDTSINSLIANDIRVLYVSPTTKKLWVGTTSGVSILQNDSDQFVNFQHHPNDLNSLSSNNIKSIFEDDLGNMWIGTNQGLCLFNSKDSTFQRIHARNPLTENHFEILDIIEKDRDQLWIGTNKGLYLLVKKNNLYELKPIALPHNELLHIRSLALDHKGNLWIGSNSKGLFYWNIISNTLTKYTHHPYQKTSLRHNEIRDLCLDHDDNLWVATFNGLSYLPKESSSFTNYAQSQKSTSGLSHNSIHSIFIDNQKSLWVGTFYGGINHWAKNYNRFHNFSHNGNKNSLSNDVVSSFAEDSLGNIWIGTEGGGLNYFNTQNQSFTSFVHQSNSNSLCGNNVKKVLIDKDKIWIGTFHEGLDLMDIKTKKFTHFKHIEGKNSISNDNIYGLLKDKENLWILTFGGGFNILNLKTNQFHSYKSNSRNNSINSNVTRVILKTDNYMWIGTERGLNKISLDEDDLPLKFETLLDNKKIYVLHHDSLDNLWIGTFGDGLYRLNLSSNDIQHFTTKDGLPGNSIFGILSDNHQHLWLSTNNGLSKLNTKLNTFTNYNSSNGLVNLEYNFNAYYKMKSGDLLFGGINGFTKFNPETIQLNTFTPPLVVTEITKNNIPIHSHKNLNDISELTFNYNEANFTIDFASLDFISPNNNRYAYMLEGLDKDWNYSTGKTKAVYRIQNEGNYTFKFKGTNSDGIWNPNTRAIKIVVLSPIWRTWWAFLLYFVFASLLTIGLFRLISLRHKLDLQKYAKQQADMLNEEKLRFFTNITHEFRTPLTLIIGPLKEILSHTGISSSIREKLTLVDKNANRLLSLVNQILTFRKLETDHEPLHITKQDFIPFLNEIYTLFKGKAALHDIKYQFIHPNEKLELWFDPQKLERVFFNLLSNAFKFTPDRGEIKIQVNDNLDFIEILVSDNGKGIDPSLHHLIFKRFYEQSNNERHSMGHTGIGLAISKKMIDLHQGEIFVQSVPNQKAGSTFVVKLKKGKTHFNSNILDQPMPTTNISIKIEDDASINPPSFEERPTLLIADDNPEVLEYITGIFTQEYKIFTAANGQEALNQTLKLKPDLVISDIMMPKMDGISFCKQLKTNFEISHIPIILLTARATSDFKIVGLKTGADDYVTKPFDPKELKLRVRNIIQNRKDIQQKFARSMSFDPQKIKITSADEIFLENALSIVEENIDNFEFNIIQFAKELAVSRPLLFTKLKSLTNQTPNNFIKTIRMKRAAQLLQTNQLNISEVAYKVGFKDPKYFRKCFQQQFEMSPSDYKKEFLQERLG